MSETKHTPGPWEVEGGVYEIWVTGPDRDAPVICDIQPRDVDACDDEDEANARLIAAAPDMLAALRALEEAFVVDRERFTESQTAAVRQMDEAVAKATGEQHDSALLAMEA